MRDLAAGHGKFCIKAFALFFVICMCMLSLSSCKSKEAYVSFFCMDTYMEITSSDTDEAVLTEAKQRILELESLLSVTDENSDIYKINHAGGKNIRVHDETYDIIGIALDMADKTGGALEPTIYPVLRAWGFTTGQYCVPGDEELEKLMRLVGHEKVLLKGGSVLLPEGCMLDMGSVAKGYASDEAAKILCDAGTKSALINLGGNIYALGTKSDGKNWNIGIQNPHGDGYAGVVSVKDRAVVTSGAYERCFTDSEGNVYGHILDPATGRPVNNGILSVTIISDSGVMADALSTALFVMGEEEAVKYWQQYGGFEMVLLTEDCRALVTEGLDCSFSKQTAEYELQWVFDNNAQNAG